MSLRKEKDGKRVCAKTIKPQKIFEKKRKENKCKVLTWQGKDGKIGIHINIYDVFRHYQ